MYEYPTDWLSILDFDAFAHLTYHRIIAFTKLAAWAMPGLILLPGVGAWRGWANQRIRILTASALITFFAYFLLKPTQGHGWGYRYFHGTWGALPLLACGAVAAPLARAGSVRAGFKPAPTGPFTPLARLAMILAVLSLVFLNGLRLYQVHAFVDRHLSQLPYLDSQTGSQAADASGGLLFGSDQEPGDSFAGKVDDMQLHGRSLTDQQVAAMLKGTMPSWLKAEKPIPADGTIGVGLLLLQWSKGETAVFHNVYLGTSPELTDADLKVARHHRRRLQECRHGRLSGPGRGDRNEVVRVEDSARRTDRRESGQGQEAVSRRGRPQQPRRRRHRPAVYR